MGQRFDAFVMFAEMRTGSNHLEESLNALEDIQCHGEVFNPTFIGHHNRFEFLGFDLTRRERDPAGLVDAMIAVKGPLPGFRFFHDHDPRVLDRILPDPRIAKVLLTRNPLDSYVSRKIASATGQWRLTDLKHAKSGKITFVAREFTQMLADWADFRDVLRKGLQVTGQTAFHIRYDDINDVDILNGLARFLGSGHTLSGVSQRLKRQNPGPVQDKVDNASEMEASLSRIDRFGFDRVTDGEVPRAPGVPGFVAHPEAGLLFLPVAGAPIDPVLDWMAGVGGVGRDGLLSGMTQKDLRKWMRAHPGFSSFCVLRHPMPRMMRVLQDLQTGADDQIVELRRVLANRYDVSLEDGAPPSGAAVLGFAGFLKDALAGRASLRAPAEWATQAAVLSAAAQVVLPQRIIREAEAAESLGELGAAPGLHVPDYHADPGPDDAWGALQSDRALQKAVFETYRKDYVQFGFAQSPGA
jgi:hypothetical protein